MHWVMQSCSKYVQRLILNIIKQGPIPNHVAFIMDGNRRYAKKNKLETKIGHSHGYNTLEDITDVCLEFNIKEITVYALSIENFKRTKKEIDELLDLLKNSFTNILSDEKKLEICRYRFIGNLSMLPDDIRSLIKKLEMKSQHNKFVLNIALAYTSTEEITTGIQSAVLQLDKNKISKKDLTVNKFSQFLYTCDSALPDLTIRTSGEQRFSDFLIWQSFNTNIYFLNALWPSFTWYHLSYILFLYQRQHKETHILKELSPKDL